MPARSYVVSCACQEKVGGKQCENKLEFLLRLFEKGKQVHRDDGTIVFRAGTPDENCDVLVAGKRSILEAASQIRFSFLNTYENDFGLIADQLPGNPLPIKIIRIYLHCRDNHLRPYAIGFKLE